MESKLFIYFVFLKHGGLYPPKKKKDYPDMCTAQTPFQPPKKKIVPISFLFLFGTMLVARRILILALTERHRFV
jgi:hypothetical protein